MCFWNASRDLASDIAMKFGGVNRDCVIGANGCRKSTFMKILGGELEPRRIPSGLSGKGSARV